MPIDLHLHLAKFEKKRWKGYQESLLEAKVATLEWEARMEAKSLFGCRSCESDFSNKPILFQRPIGMGFYNFHRGQLSGGLQSSEKSGGVCEEQREADILGGSTRPSKPDCREWQAKGSCKFGETCWFHHQSAVEIATIGDTQSHSVEKTQVRVLNASRPLGISARGTVIRVGSSDLREVLKTFDETAKLEDDSTSCCMAYPGMHLMCHPKAHSSIEQLRSCYPEKCKVIEKLHFRNFDSDSQSKFYLRRLLRVLLEPLFQSCADDIAFGVGFDVCFVRRRKSQNRELRYHDIKHALHFFAISQTSMSIEKLEVLFLKEDFEYHKFQKAIAKHVISVAAELAASDNDWLHANFVQPRVYAVKGMYSHNIREFDETNVEQEARRLSAIRSIMFKCKPKFASRLANACFLRFEPECLDRLIHCPLTASIKFDIALSELHKRCPEEAEILKFCMGRKMPSQKHNSAWENSVSLPKAQFDDRSVSKQTFSLKQRRVSAQMPSCQDSKDILSDAIRQLFCREAAVTGVLGLLPVWLQHLPCTTSVSENHPIQVACQAPTKVYLLSVGTRSFEAAAATPKMWKSEGREKWAFVKQKHIWPEVREQIYMNPLGTSAETIEISLSQEENEEKRFLEAFQCQENLKTLTELGDSIWRKRLPPGSTSEESFEIFSTILQPGMHALDTTDAIYFFDTAHHEQQRSIQASNATLCVCFQLSGTCCLGDRCPYSHKPPLVYTPDTFAYMGYMQQQSRKQLCASLRLQMVNTATWNRVRSRVYRQQIIPTSWFPARNRVPTSALLTALVLRLLRDTHLLKAGNFNALHISAAHLIPMRLYKGLMVKASEIDNDAFAFVEHGGYVFRTLLGRSHTPRIHYLDCGAISITGRQCIENDEEITRQLSAGYEIAPPDDASIEVCATYEWQSQSLLLNNGRSYRTRLNYEVMQKIQRKLRKKAKSTAAKNGSEEPAPTASRHPQLHQMLLPMQDVQHLTPQVETNAKIVRIEGRAVTVSRGDVLIRRRCWSLM